MLAISAMVLLSSCDKSEVNQEGTHVVVQPSWGEAFHYANIAKPSQVPWTILGITLIATFFVLAYVANKKMKKSPVAFVVIAFIVLIPSGIASLISKPNAVRMDNTPTVSKEYFEKVGQTYILDSMFNSNHLSNAAVK